MTTPQNQGEVPQYRVLRDSFYQPRLVKAGSIISTWGIPGDHLQPLNDSARAKMEEWYDEEHPTRDRDGKADFTKMYKPHERFRINVSAPGEQHDMTLLAEPKPDDMTGSLSLAEAHQIARRDTDQRPGALAAPEVVPTAEALAREGEPKTEQLTEAAPTAAVIAEAPVDPKLANLKVK